MFNYRGSTALVTGASKGIGEAFAEHLAARGMNLVLVARSLDALDSLAKRLSDKYGGNYVTLKADLADPDITNWIAGELERRGIQVDLLVNNAGLGLTQVPGVASLLGWRNSPMLESEFLGRQWAVAAEDNIADFYTNAV
jgi:short-subunit dehydrogenase